MATSADWDWTTQAVDSLDRFHRKVYSVLQQMVHWRASWWRICSIWWDSRTQVSWVPYGSNSTESGPQNLQSWTQVDRWIRPQLESRKERGEYPGKTGWCFGLIKRKRKTFAIYSSSWARFPISDEVERNPNAGEVGLDANQWKSVEVLDGVEWDPF